MIKRNQTKSNQKTEDFMEIGGAPIPGIILRQVLRGHTASIHRIAWSPDGQLLASPSRDKSVRIWDWRSGNIKRILTNQEQWVNCAIWSPDGKWLAAGLESGTIKIWNTSSWDDELILNGHRGRIEDLAWSQDSKVIASASGDGTAKVWSILTGDQLHNFVEHRVWVNAVEWSPDGKFLATGAEDNTVRIWNYGTWTSVKIFDQRDWVTDLAWSPDGNWLVSTSGMLVTIWDPNSGLKKGVLEGHTDRTKVVSFSPNGRILASKSEDGTVRIWRTDSWETMAVVEESTINEVNPENSIAFHPSDSILATLGQNDTVIRIWQIDTSHILNDFFGEDVKYTSAKLVILGDPSVGKTGLGWRMAHGAFKEHASTHGQQFWPIKQLGKKREDGTECEAMLWDLAGQHVFRSIHSIFLDNVDAALILFDPSNRQEPLKGVQFWIEQLKGKTQLPPSILVGARVDLGAPVLSQQELEQFCQRYGISGGYISTSAKSGEGIERLLEMLKAQIPWDNMTTTVTTATFKRIKDHVLALKGKPDRKGVLLHPAELRQQLQTTDPSWQFTNAEIMTAVGHLQNHGYVIILHSSSGETFILLMPELLVNLASSIVLLADKNQRELGAVSESELLQGKYEFEELKGLEKAEGQILLDAAILRFLQHNICFRETLGNDILLILPSLIKQKRHLLDEVEIKDDVSYIVHGRVENIYAALVVLLGYTPMFTRINQWQNQAQYELGEDEICGFRLIEAREGELELVLYYSATMPDYGCTMFQGLFEKFLYQRDVDVKRFPLIVCPNAHRQERVTVVKRIREHKKFLFCEECGVKITLPEIEKPQAFGTQAARSIQREEALAHLRSAYETHLVCVKGFRRDRATPRCYLSYTPEQTAWVADLAHDLRDSGIYLVEERAQLQASDFVILIGTPAYKTAWERRAEPIAADVPLIQARAQQSTTSWPTLVPLLREGNIGAACPRELRNLHMGDFREEARYAISLFDLVLTLYAIPFNHPGFEPLRKSLSQQWERTLARLVDPLEIRQDEDEAELRSAEATAMNYHDFQVLIAADRKIRASSEQGEERGELRLDMNKIKLALKLLEQQQTDAELLKSLGNEFYQALFPARLHGQLRATMTGAEKEGSGVRLRLTFEAPELAALPWEFLYDEGTDTFLANNTQTALSRYIDIPLQKRDLKAASLPLKVLLVIASPTDMVRLDATQEEQLIRTALASHVETGQVEIEVVREATLRNINQKLREKPYNVFHFIGHALFKDDKGFIALVDQDGKAKLLDDEDFANFFLGNRSLGVAVLNACQGAQVSANRVFAGLAPNLVRRGIPAVVAMQYPILDTTAKLFTDEFYRTLALGWPVDAALQTTRNAISMEVGQDKPDFATPVLYMRAKDGVILSGL